MGRRILLVVVVLIVAAFAYVGYTSYDAKRAETRGDVFSRDGSLSRSKGDTAQTTDFSNDTQDKTSDQPQTAANPAVPAAQTTQAAADSRTQPSVAPGASGADTISPNPPNGMVFSGTGHFQLYRQGNLTWRVNTETGQSCILFATDEEWKKAKVYRNGCGNR